VCIHSEFDETSPRKGQKGKWILFGFVFCALSFGEQSTPLKAVKRSSLIPSSIFGGAEIRPSFDTKDSGFFSENCAHLGMKFGSQTSLRYVQQINTVPTSSEEKSGSVALSDGYMRADFSDIVRGFEDRVGMSLETRVYVPTDSAKKDAGMISIWRNYLKLSNQVSQSVAFKFAAVPILHFYNKSGVASAGSASANPIFENRFILGPDIALSESVSLSLPVHFYLVKFRAFAPADNSDSWTQYLGFEPELTYSITPNYYFGAAYRTTNLIQQEETGATLNDGFAKGAIQAVVGISF
jgi:hypothetical protein